MDKTSKKDERKPVPFDQVVKRLLGTPPAPHEDKSDGKQAQQKKRKRSVRG